MKRFFTTIALVAAFMLMSAPAWSNTYENHVSQASNGKGDVLIFPVYFAFDGFHTKIQVINTSTNVSAVAKVVIRSPYNSLELLDFFIFLSPTDVFEGYLRWNNNRTEIYTENESFLATATPTFASKDEPFSMAIQPKCGDPVFYGYAEVFLARVFPNNYEWPVGSGNIVNLTNPRVDKKDIYEAFVGPNSLTDPLPRTGLRPNAFAGSNILAGNLQIQAPLLNWSAALNATTLKDYNLTGVENVVQETIFGRRANNNILEVEAALAKNDIGLPYINNAEGNTFHFFNFPTRLTIMNDDCGIIGLAGQYSGFELHNLLTLPPQPPVFETIRVRQRMNGYDQEERTQVGPSPIFSPAPVLEGYFTHELELVMPETFEKGWYRYNFGEDVLQWTTGVNRANQNLRYRGAPVIPVAMNFGMDSGFSLMYGFSSDGQVQGDHPTIAGVWSDMPGYQYARYTPPTE